MAVAATSRRGKGVEVKAPVKAIGEGGQVAGSVFGEIKRMVAPLKPVLRLPRIVLTQPRLGNLIGFARADDDGLVITPRCRHPGEAGQPIGMTWLPGARAALAQPVRAAQVNPGTGIILVWRGCPSAFRETAATKGPCFRNPGRLCRPPVRRPGKRRPPAPHRTGRTGRRARSSSASICVESAKRSGSSPPSDASRPAPINPVFASLIQ
jgi:hypothetical protein